MDAQAHDEFLLGAYVLGLLCGDEAARTRAHLEGCADCRREYEQLTATHRAILRVPPGLLVMGPPAGSDAVLRSTARAIAAEREPSRERVGRRTLTLAASVAALAGAMAAGVGIGINIAPVTSAVGPSQSSGPSPTATSPAGVRLGVVVDGETHVTLAVTIVPANGWIRLNTAVTGVPAGRKCQLLVVGRDGRVEVAGGWVASKKGEADAVLVDGSAPIPIDEVTAIKVADSAGAVYVTLSM
jgi:hypothetical protein